MNAKHLKNPSASNKQRGFCLSVITTPLGNIAIEAEHDGLVSLKYVSDKTPLKTASDTLSKQVAQELRAYFKKPDQSFKSRLNLIGTDFQKNVWQALQAIPTGETLTYGELAKKLKSSPRAIGQACRTNPIPIIVPCHRVVAKTNIGGYSGKTKGSKLAIKQWLLEHEQSL